MQKDFNEFIQYLNSGVLNNIATTAAKKVGESYLKQTNDNAIALDDNRLKSLYGAFAASEADILAFIEILRLYHNWLNASQELQ